MVRAGLVAAALLAAFATGCGGHGRARGTIVFESDRSGVDALYAIRADGGKLTKLLNLPEEADVFWSRDGTRALVRDSRSYVFAPADRTRRSIRLPGFEKATGIAAWSDLLWSPDGKRIAYATESGAIIMLDVESGERRLITRGSSTGAVAWSPDGKRVLFIDYSSGSVYTAAADGGARVRVLRLPSDLGPDALPGWSGDGKWISLFNALGFPAKLYVARADGTGLESIARNAKSAAWSPAGEQIAFAAGSGIVVVDLEHTRRRQLTRNGLDGSPSWSSDGARILFTRNDLGQGAPPGHDQLWTMKADGSDQRPVTHAFTDGGSNGPAVWVGSTVSGTPAEQMPLVTLRGARTIVTRLPIVALAATRSRAAVAQGLGGPRNFRGPFGPLIVWNPVRSTESQIPIPGCGSAYDVELAGVFFTAGGVGYRCDNPSISYGEDDTLRLVRPGKHSVVILHTQDGEFSGLYLDGLAGERNAIAFGVGELGTNAERNVYTARTSIWKGAGVRRTMVQTFHGDAAVTSLDHGRIAVVREGRAVSVLFPRGRSRTFAFRRGSVLGAALDGARLLVLQNVRLAVFDLGSGRRTASWPLRRGFGPAPELEGAHGDLAAYVVGAAIHVLRLSDGREIVIDTPNATKPVLARFVQGGLFYSFNESYGKRPGRLVFVTRSELERALG